MSRLIDADEIFYDQLLNTGRKEHPLEFAVSKKRIDDMPTIEPEITLLQATKTVLEFMGLCGGTTAFLITPDDKRLSCDWGYVEDGLRELVRYAELRLR